MAPGEVSAQIADEAMGMLDSVLASSFARLVRSTPREAFGLQPIHDHLSPGYARGTSVTLIPLLDLTLVAG
jgi:hypothetical protein